MIESYVGLKLIERREGTFTRPICRPIDVN